MFQFLLRNRLDKLLRRDGGLAVELFQLSSCHSRSSQRLPFANNLAH